MSTPDQAVTQALAALQAGERGAADRLFPLVYAELRRAAGRLLAQERVGHTLQPTALVHEAYLKLAGQRITDLQSEAHFLGLAARAMRQILVDHARKRTAAKRGGSAAMITLDEGNAPGIVADDSLVALDESLERLAALDPRLAQVVELRFFGGLTEPQIALTLEVTTRTVQRDWTKARAWLHAQLASSA